MDSFDLDPSRSSCLNLRSLILCTLTYTERDGVKPTWHSLHHFSLPNRKSDQDPSFAPGYRHSISAPKTKDIITSHHILALRNSRPDIKASTRPCQPHPETARTQTPYGQQYRPRSHPQPPL